MYNSDIIRSFCDLEDMIVCLVYSFMLRSFIVLSVCDSLRCQMHVHPLRSVQHQPIYIYTGSSLQCFPTECFFFQTGQSALFFLCSGLHASWCTWVLAFPKVVSNKWELSKYCVCMAQDTMLWLSGIEFRKLRQSLQSSNLIPLANCVQLIVSV